MSAGTSMHCGVKEYCWPIARTVTEPSGSSALPRLLSMNSPAEMQGARVDGFDAALRHGGLVQPGEDGHDHEQDDEDDAKPSPSGARRARRVGAVVRDDG